MMLLFFPAKFLPGPCVFILFSLDLRNITIQNMIFTDLIMFSIIFSDVRYHESMICNAVC